jgi:hypothetical protein
MAISKINSRSIQDGTVVGADITPGTVTNAKISPSAAIANAKLANSSITISGSSVSLGGSVTVNTAIDWQAITVADGSTTVNCVSGKGYFLDTNAGVIEAFLPTSPTRGDRVVLADYSGTFATNQAIVNTGGELLDSTAGNDFKLTTNNTIAEFIYVDAAKGWLVYLNQAAGTTPSSALDGGVYDRDELVSATGGTITNSGDYRIHTFTGDGCFTVSTINPSSPSTVDYLVVAGGGGGGGQGGGGGGAGGFREGKQACGSPHTASPLASTAGIPISVTSYPITVGGGGSAGLRPSPSPACITAGGDGSNSVFSTITSTGGGGGYDGTTGGSGGSGGAGGESSVGSAVGSGNTPPTSPPQGNPGGASEYSPPAGGPHPESPQPYAGGGGGGAGAQGGQSDSSPGDNGGVGGVGSYVSPSFAVGCAGTTGPVCGVRYFAGGGAGNGCAASNPGTPVPAPLGGGGAGTTGPCSGVAGTANTGGGGAAWGDIYNPGSGGAGGKGIVIIRYKFQ